MPRMRFSVLAVGQGSGNFIEVFEGTDNTPKMAILIDLGSSGAADDPTSVPVDYVFQQLKKMKDKYTKAVLSAVIFSHPDIDHINLINKLLDKCDAGLGSSKLVINKVMYGADRGAYIKGQSNKPDVDYLKRVSTYIPGGQLTYFGVETGNLTVPIINTDGVTLHLLLGNTVYGKLKTFSHGSTKVELDGYRSNTSSLVIGVQYAGVNIVVTGDATGLTMSRLNDRLAGKNLRSFMLTVPHHGARRTALDMKPSASSVLGKRKKSDPASVVLESFISKISPVTISASAWEQRNFKHPHVEIIRYFSKFLDPANIAIWSDPIIGASKEHFFTTWMPAGYLTPTKAAKAPTAPTVPTVKPAQWPKIPNFYTVQTAAPVFTNDYYMSLSSTIAEFDPKAGASSLLGTQTVSSYRAVAWAFEVAGDGSRRIGPIMANGDIKQLAPAHAALLLRSAEGDHGDEFVFLAPLPEGDAPEAPAPPPVRRAKRLPRAIQRRRSARSHPVE